MIGGPFGCWIEVVRQAVIIMVMVVMVVIVVTMFVGFAMGEFYKY